MAKQKKKRKKKKIVELPKIDKFLYWLISNVITISVFVIFVIKAVNYLDIIESKFYNGDLLYSRSLSNGFTFCYIVAFIIMFIGGLILYFILATTNVKFKEFLSNKKSITRKIFKAGMIFFIVICLFLAILDYLQIYSRVDATDKNITYYHLIADDTVTEYDSVESAKLEVRRDVDIEIHPSIRRYRFSIDYYVVVTLSVDGKESEFKEYDFVDRYAGVVKFLDCIDKDKITVDDKYVEKILRDEKRNDKYFRELFEIE